ncbi:unnamed protein product [Scytosiphon promiscuus]
MEKKAAFEDISVAIFKEGDRSLQVEIPVRIHAAHSQSAWVPFLNRVMYELKLEEIDGVYEDVDGAPIARISSLVDGGLYFARPTEVSAMLRSLVGTEQEHYPAWPSIEEGIEAKRELERCRQYYEQHLLPMSSDGESKTATTDITPQIGETPAGFVWAMKVKQGFKSKVYRTPECRPDEVVDVLPMGAIVTLSTDWGEMLEKHPSRSKGGRGKVLWMIAPQEGFLERRPLEDLPVGVGAQVAAKTTPSPASAVLTSEERMEIVRNATHVSDFLRATLRRGAYFEGAVGVHDCVEVHRAALRAAATMMRKDSAWREALLKCRGIELFVAIVKKFGEEDRLLCEYGCWAFAVFAGEGDSHPGDDVFQETLSQAGGLEAMASAVDVHGDSVSLRSRYCVAALAAAVHENTSTAGKLHSLNLHVTVAEDSIRRWPNNPELSCLACWVLRSVVEPPNSGLHLQDDPCATGRSPSFPLGDDGGGGSIVSSLGTIFAEEGGEEEARETGGRAVVSATSSKRDVSLVDGRGTVLDGPSVAGDNRSSTSGGIFGTGADETSDFLISLADNDADRDAHEGLDGGGVSTDDAEKTESFARPTIGTSPVPPNKINLGSTDTSLTATTSVNGREDSPSCVRERGKQGHSPGGQNMAGKNARGSGSNWH